jgi:hypothetical protein
MIMSVAYSLERPPVKFPNLLSRLLLQRGFDRQFIVPGETPRLMRWFLTFVERCLLRVDTRGIEVRKPIFLLGLHRSGTTMLQDLLCSLPEVSYITNRMSIHPSNLCAAETVARWLQLDARGERFLRDGVELTGSSPNEGVPFWQSWLGEDPYDYRYVERRPEDFSPDRREAIFNDIRKILWCFWPRGGRFLAKNPCLVPYARLLGQLFPDARFIHILRDPRQTAHSMVKLYRMVQQQLEWIRSHGGHGIYDDRPYMPYPRLPRLAEYVEQYGPEDIRTTARLWRDGVSLLDEVKDQMPSFLEVRYEDILANPRGSLERILDFCKLDATVQQTEFAKRLANVGKVPTRGRYDGSDVIEEICGDVMHQHGYQLHSRHLSSSL